MRLNFWSTNFWMSLAYSDESFGTIAGGELAPMAEAPASAPSNENWLKFLSSSVPTSVTTPTFHVPLAAPDEDGAADPEAAGDSADDGAAADGATVGAAGVGVAAVEQADNTSAITLNRAIPIERVRMLPPPTRRQPVVPSGCCPRIATERRSAPRSRVATSAHRTGGPGPRQARFGPALHRAVHRAAGAVDDARRGSRCATVRRT